MGEQRPLRGDDEGKIVRAIYELDSDSLKQCWTVERERPRAIDPNPDPGANYSVYKFEPCRGQRVGDSAISAAAAVSEP